MADFDQSHRGERRDAKDKAQIPKVSASGLRREAIYALLLILIACAGTKAAAAISLAEYRERIGQATIALDSLTSFDESLSGIPRNMPSDGITER